jgi:U3 small nucleolar RNA-associated protein 11
VAYGCLLLTAAHCCTASCACRRKASAYRELSQRLERQQKLAALASKMDFDKQLMGKGRKRKLAGAEGSSSQPVYRWKRERKK